MKLTKNGYRITKNGNIMNSIESDAIVKTGNVVLESTIKFQGQYYFFNRVQGDKIIYLP